MLEVALGRHHLTATAEQGFGDERGHAVPSRFEVRCSPRDIGGEAAAGIAVVELLPLAVGIGHLRHGHVVGRAGTALAVEFVRADIDQAGGMPVGTHPRR